MTAGPLPHTVVDFWQMVWQERTPLIVMLCNTVEGHRVRCQQYWPSSGSQKYGPFTVKLEKEQRLADCVLRLFKITVCIYHLDVYLLAQLEQLLSTIKDDLSVAFCELGICEMNNLLL